MGLELLLNLRHNLFVFYLVQSKSVTAMYYRRRKKPRSGVNKMYKNSNLSGKNAL